MTEFPSHPPDSRVLAAFFVTTCGDLDAVIEMRERLFYAAPLGQDDQRAELLDAIGDAWGEVLQTLPSVLDALLSPWPEEELRRVGLTGAQLRFKILAWRESRVELYQAFADSEDSEDEDPGPSEPLAGVPSDLPTDPPLPKKKPRWMKWALKKLGETLEAADTIIGSLGGAVNLSEPVKEIKEAVEKLAKKTSSGLPDEPS